MYITMHSNMNIK